MLVGIWKTADSAVRARGRRAVRCKCPWSPTAGCVGYQRRVRTYASGPTFVLARVAANAFASSVFFIPSLKGLFMGLKKVEVKAVRVEVDLA